MGFISARLAVVHVSGIDRPNVTLTSRQRQFLKGRAHKLSAIVQIGSAGVTDGVRAAVDRALLDHELIKVKVGKGIETEISEIVDDLTGALDASSCQVIGRTIVLFRARNDPKKPGIELPTA